MPEQSPVPRPSQATPGWEGGGSTYSRRGALIRLSCKAGPESGATTPHVTITAQYLGNWGINITSPVLGQVRISSLVHTGMLDITFLNDQTKQKVHTKVMLCCSTT